MCNEGNINQTSVDFFFKNGFWFCKSTLYMYVHNVCMYVYRLIIYSSWHQKRSLHHTFNSIFYYK